MSIVKLRGTVDSEGLLTARMPKPSRSGEVELLVNVPDATGSGNHLPQPELESEAATLDERRELFRSLFGILRDEDIERLDQGEFETRLALK